MIAYGRQFRVVQLARAMRVVGSAASPLLLKALRNGTRTAFEFSARAVVPFARPVSRYREKSQPCLN